MIRGPPANPRRDTNLNKPHEQGELMRRTILGALALLPTLAGCGTGEPRTVYRSNGVEQEIPARYAEDMRRLDRLDQRPGDFSGRTLDYTSQR